MAACPVFARERTDVVVLANGDRVTGEIKQLEHGILDVSTDSMADVRIEWDDVIRIESDYEFQFERTDGQRIVGLIEAADDQQEITVTNDERRASFAHDQVIRIAQMEDSFWERVSGTANFGYNFTKAKSIAQLNYDVHANHRTEVRMFTLDSHFFTSTDQTEESTQRSDLNLSMTRFRDNRWFNTYLLGFESNDELGLELRTSIGGGIGRYMIQTNTSELSLLAGLMVTTESLTKVRIPGPDDVSSNEENIEAILGVAFSKFIFDDPKVDLSLKLSVFPSITDSGRTRAQFDANLRRELIKDLYFNLSYYNSYDSNPPSGAAQSKDDYGIVTTLGWSF